MVHHTYRCVLLPDPSPPTPNHGPVFIELRLLKWDARLDKVRFPLCGINFRTGQLCGWQGPDDALNANIEAESLLQRTANRDRAQKRNLSCDRCGAVWLGTVPYLYQRGRVKRDRPTAMRDLERCFVALWVSAIAASAR